MALNVTLNLPFSHVIKETKQQFREVNWIVVERIEFKAQFSPGTLEIWTLIWNLDKPLDMWQLLGKNKGRVQRTQRDLAENSLFLVTDREGHQSLSRETNKKIESFLSFLVFCWVY